MTDQRERLSATNLRCFRADANLMTDKPFSRKKTHISHNHRLLGVGSRENAGIFLRSGALRERSIARSIGRARIETYRKTARYQYSMGIARSIGRARIETGSG